MAIVPSDNSDAAPPDLQDVIITDELEGRPPRPRDSAAEIAAMRAVAARFSGPAMGIFDTLAREAMRLCSAGSAGLALTEELPGGGLTMRWHSITGIMRDLDDPQIAWHESLGGVSIQRAAPVLFRDPGRAFPRLEGVRPRIVEALAVPIPGPAGGRVRDGGSKGLAPGRAGEGSEAHGPSDDDASQLGAPIGAVWVVRHQGDGAENREAEGKPRGFDLEDVRLLTALALFAGAGALAAQLREVSEQALREAEHARHELRRSNEDLEQFAAIAAHDLKEPLRGMGHYASFVREDEGAGLGEESIARLLTIERMAGRMQQMLDGLMEFARAGHGNLETVPVAMDDVVADAVESLRSLINAHRVEIEIGQPLPAVCCDRTTMAQVVTNLIANGIKYNRAEVKRIQFGVLPAGAALPPGMPEGGQGNAEGGAGPRAVLYVRDNGIGLSARDAVSIFQMFRRVPGSDSLAGGSGAGLAIVRRILERHGGRVWAESVGEQGSTFFFTLPVCELNDRVDGAQPVEELKKQ